MYVSDIADFDKNVDLLHCHHIKFSLPLTALVDITIKQCLLHRSQWAIQGLLPLINVIHFVPCADISKNGCYDGFVAVRLKG